jgi:hypothetical protein
MIAKLLWIKRNNQDHQIEVILDYINSFFRF